MQLSLCRLPKNYSVCHCASAPLRLSVSLAAVASAEGYHVRNNFLNYRRDDARWPASILYYWLAQYFSREHLFMDVAGYIRPGDDFVEVLN